MQLSAPISVDINLTNICNLSCDFCSATPFFHTAKSDELSLEEISKIFDELDRLGVFIVRLAGGEPLIRRDIVDIIRLTNNRFFDSVILSNGLYLNEKIVSSMLDVGMQSIALSVDGHISEIHDKQRNKLGVFDKLMGKLPMLQELGLDFTAMTTVTSDNVDYLVEITKFLDSKGFKSVNFILLNFSGLANKPGQFSSWKRWSKALVELTVFLYSHKLNIMVSILPPHEDPVPYEIYKPLSDNQMLDLMEKVWGISNNPDIHDGNTIGCAAGRTQATIFENGDVYGCELMRGFSEFKAGNIREASLGSIWTSSVTFEKLRNLRKGDLKGGCASCEQMCGGGCRASAANITKKFDGSDENCHIIRII